MIRLRSKGILALIILLGMFLSSHVSAQEGPQTYSGDLWSRSTLTGDWGGIRNEWAKKGVTFDLNLTQVGQGDISGGKKIGWEYGGRGDLTLNGRYAETGMVAGRLLHSGSGG